MNLMTPEQLITLFNTFIQDPRFSPVELSSFKDTIAVLEEYSEIKPHLEAEVARLQKERDVAVASRKAAQIRVDELNTLRQTDGKDFNIEKSKLLVKIAELEKDKARLDFVLRCLLFAGASLEYDGYIYDLDSLTYTFTSTSVYSLDTIYGTGNSEYEAIDAAMEAEQ